MKKSLAVLVVFIIVVVNAVIFASLYQRSLAPEDSGAATDVRTVFNLTSPASVTGAAVGSNMTVSMALQNTTSISVGEIVINFDPAVLTAQSISEATNPSNGEAYVLALNKTMDNTLGRITVDIANSGAGNFPANTNLVNFGFTLKSAAVNTTISTSNQTTLGTPNQLQASGLGSIQLKFIATVCGDGTVQTPNDGGFNEQCDNGASNGVACTPSYGSSCQYCASNCTTTTVQGGVCGDGTKQTQEQCDSGANNGVACTPAYGGSCNYCNNSCQTTTVQGARCGDSITQTGNGEQCDNGSNNGTACTPTYGNNCNYCNNTCQSVSVTGPKCGDGIKQTQEQCDDSNLADFDSCSMNCQVACAAGTVAKGNKCVPIACRGDYVSTGVSLNVLDISDFSIFAQNYKKVGIECNKDISIVGGVCYLDINDLALFAQSYKVANACL